MVARLMDFIIVFGIFAFWFGLALLFAIPFGRLLKRSSDFDGEEHLQATDQYRREI